MWNCSSNGSGSILRSRNSVCGVDGERRPDPDECRDHNLLPCGGRMQGTETGALDMRASSNTERITYGQDSHAGTFRETGARGP